MFLRIHKMHKHIVHHRDVRQIVLKVLLSKFTKCISLQLWNTLPRNLRAIENYDTFKRAIETHLFTCTILTDIPIFIHLCIFYVNVHSISTL